MKKISMNAKKTIVVVGNDTFRTVIQGNENNVGESQIFILENNEDLPKDVEYRIIIFGRDINIYLFDDEYNEKIVETISGRFLIATLNGSVYFFEL